MDETIHSPPRSFSKAAFKAIFLLVFIAGAIFLIRLTPIRNYLTPEALGNFLKIAGIWTLVVYILIYTVGCLPISPGNIADRFGGRDIRRILEFFICLVWRHVRCKYCLFYWQDIGQGVCWIVDRRST